MFCFNYSSFLSMRIRGQGSVLIAFLASVTAGHGLTALSLFVVAQGQGPSVACDQQNTGLRAYFLGGWDAALDSLWWLYSTRRCPVVSSPHLILSANRTEVNSGVCSTTPIVFHAHL